MTYAASAPSGESWTSVMKRKRKRSSGTRGRTGARRYQRHDFAVHDDATLRTSEFAPWRHRRHLDPSFLAEVVDHSVAWIFDGVASIHLRARNHERAVSAVQRPRRTRPIPLTRDHESGDEPRARAEGEQQENDDLDSAIVPL